MGYLPAFAPVLRVRNRKCGMETFFFPDTLDGGGGAGWLVV